MQLTVGFRYEIYIGMATFVEILHFLNQSNKNLVERLIIMSATM